ncbi:MAG: SLBB domain-containing protein [Bacteroidales bacterium]|nr:SLBB domain-containing protein [Bacteroidales bacterium]
MKKIFIIAVIALLSAGFTAQAQMTDDQVVKYVQSAMEAGKSQDEIGMDLLARGVTKEQAERIKKKYQEQQSTDDLLTSGVNRNRSKGKVVSKGKSLKKVSTGDEFTSEYAGTRFEAPLRIDLQENEMAFITDSLTTSLESIEGKNKPREERIFGHDIFNNEDLSFEPNENAATPQNYRLGPGDEVMIDIWGYNEASFSETISPEGRIHISQVGPVSLSGLTIDQATSKIRRTLASKYSGLEGQQSSVSVSLGQIRTIQVNVMGEVEMPGTFRLSSFSSVFHALYSAGGVTETGSLREVKVMRAGKEVAVVDVYEYIFNGSFSTDVKLQEGDVVIVPPYQNLVKVTGKAKRPMFYELTSTETLQNLIDYAGGFAAGAYEQDVRVERNNGLEKSLYTVAKSNFSNFVMANGDEISIDETLDRYTNKVEVRGFVFRPGAFELGDDIATVKQLVKRAGGLTEDAFLSRAVILREKADLNLEVVSVNIGAIVGGQEEDVLLKKNDVLVISSKHEINDRGTMTINGMVAKPSTFAFAENTNVEDLIIMAGGLLDGASLARVDVARRVIDRNGVVASDVVGETFSFPIKDGLVAGADDFVLMPYDVVSVRPAPGYSEQQYVTLEGEFTFPGDYALISKGERLSDMIARAGGLTPQAYAPGVKVVRKTNAASAEEIERLMNKNAQRDSVDVKELNLSGTVNVAIDVQKAMANPGTEWDIMLKPGDRIVVPETEYTVTIQGSVMFPNAVTYVPGKPLSYYINAAGGYSQDAKKSKVYAIYMNGSAASSKKAGFRIEPGCTIIVPAKPDRQPVTLADVSAMTSASSSIISMMAMLSSLLK